MSTKTTFKRIALVTVAALGLGVLASVPSSAAQSVAQTYIFCSNGDGGAISNTTTTGAECAGVAGTSNFVTITSVNQAKDIEVTGATFSTPGSGWTLNTAGTVANFPASTSAATLRVLTPTAGTITLTVKAATAGSGIYAATTETVVITVGATALSGAYNATNSSAYIVAGETNTASADATTAISAAKTVPASTDTATASIVVTYLDGLKAAVKGDTLTATITSGPGNIATSVLTSGLTGATGSYFDSRTANANTGHTLLASSAAQQYSASAQADGQGKVAFYVWPNGLPGTSVITVKNTAGTVVATKSLTFTDTTIASIEATVVKAFVQGDTAANTSGAIKLVVKDSAGNPISGATAPTVTDDNALVAAGNASNGTDTGTSSATGVIYYYVGANTAATYGPVAFTFTSGTVTAKATVTLSSAVAATFTVAAAAAAVTVGQKISYTITAKDAKGYAVPDGSTLSNYVAGVSTGGTSANPADNETVPGSVAGVWTASHTAPLASTDIKTTWTLTGTAGTANSYLAKTLTETEQTTSVSISNPGIDAAAAAAEEATAAANDATDAALSAAEAAEAATAMAQEAVDAVAELSASVTKLISALRAQITTLTNLVVKIQKKVKA